MSMMAIIAGMMIPMYVQIQVYSNLDTATENLVQATRTARTLSQTGKFDSAWGVYFPNGTLFAGTTYATRSASKDISFALSGNVGIQGLTELVFARENGLPTATGVVCVYSLTNAAYRTITMTGNGVMNVSNIQKGFCSGI